MTELCTLIIYAFLLLHQLFFYPKSCRFMSIFSRRFNFAIFLPRETKSLAKIYIYLQSVVNTRHSVSILDVSVKSMELILLSSCRLQHFCQNLLDRSIIVSMCILSLFRRTCYNYTVILAIFELRISFRPRC